MDRQHPLGEHAEYFSNFEEMKLLLEFFAGNGFFLLYPYGALALELRIGQDVEMRVEARCQGLIVHTVFYYIYQMKELFSTLFII